MPLVFTPKWHILKANGWTYAKSRGLEIDHRYYLKSEPELVYTGALDVLLRHFKMTKEARCLSPLRGSLCAVSLSTAPLT